MAEATSGFRDRQDSYIAGLAATGIAMHLTLRHLLQVPVAGWQVPLFATLLLGGVPLAISLIQKLVAREFGSDLLAGLSIFTSVLLGEYLVGSIIVLMLAGGRALEQYATRRAASVLDALARRMPRIAHRKMDFGISDVDVGQITVGDAVVLYPHEICPVDGIVLQGHGTMDEAYLTGEPFQISKTPGAHVLSGAINGAAALTIQAEKIVEDSRYAKIMQVMQESEQKRPRLRRLGDRLGAWYTPWALAIAGLAGLLTQDPQRFLAVLVIATPCPLLIAIPVAVVGAISVAARRAIIIKNPAVLEEITTCRTHIFDKTGTLTYGKPSLTEICCLPGFTQAEVLRLAASLERYSKHPLSAAILHAARDAALELKDASQVSENPGTGLTGIVGERLVHITGRGKVTDASVALPPAGPGIECLVFIEGVCAAGFRFHDEPRKESRSFVRHLGPRHQVSKLMLVSGDRKEEVQYLANLVGITEVRFGQSPEEKLAIVKHETSQAPTLFVGDGINDAPALMTATVGLAFGQNSDITSEAAGAVILSASLAKVDELIHIGRRMRSIALQSAIGGMALSILGMLAAATGHLPPLEGAIAQEIIDVAAVLNALRVALPSDELTDF